MTAILDTVRSWAGLSGRHPHPEVCYRTAQLLLPEDEVGWALRYLRGSLGHVPSVCALTVMAYLRARGVRHKALELRYEHQIGMAMADVETVCRALGVWTESPVELAEVPSPEDVIRVGNDGSLGLAHVFTITGYDPATGVVTSLDGGQVDNSWLLPRRRILLAEPDGAYYVDPEKPRLADGRPNGRRCTGRGKFGDAPADTERPPPAAA